MAYRSFNPPMALRSDSRMRVKRWEVSISVAGLSLRCVSLELRRLLGANRSFSPLLHRHFSMLHKTTALWMNGRLVNSRIVQRLPRRCRYIGIPSSPKQILPKLPLQGVFCILLVLFHKFWMRWFLSLKYEGWIMSVSRLDIGLLMFLLENPILRDSYRILQGRLVGRRNTVSRSSWTFTVNIYHIRNCYAQFNGLV